MSASRATRASLAPHDWIVPDWPAPARVRAFVTTRSGGVSTGEYGTLNLGGSGGDAAGNVARNREIVRSFLPEAPRWLRQVHGTDVADLDRAPDGGVLTADAAATSQAGRVCSVLTADCMPLLLCDSDGRRVAIAHAGWRGLAAGVVENAVAALGAEPAKVLAWMGPAIGPRAFEVGAEVREAFVRARPEAASAFAPHVPGKYLADLYALARQRLAALGVRSISGGGFCTYSEPERFFSYRREKASGRMGAFIWLAP
jgi:polyphenol oxidase